MESKTSYTQEHPTTCNICGGVVVLINTGKQYSRSRFIYKCTQCGASVGTHTKEPTKALGTLADTETKQKRREVHTWFDKLWSNSEERENYYQRLANELGIERDKCHFGTMNKGQLEKSLTIIKKWWLEKFDK